MAQPNKAPVTRRRTAADVITHHREEHERCLRAVAEEFGWRQRDPALVPEDAWSADHPIARLAAEILFLRKQIARLGKAMRLTEARAPWHILMPGPHWKGESR